MSTFRWNRCYLKYIILLTLLCFVCSGCAEKMPSEKIAITINNYSISAAEFNKLFSEVKISEDTPKAREAFLENLINRKLMLQEAQRQQLDRKGYFLKAIERFWEQSLLSIVIDKKIKEISKGITVSEEEIQNYYNAWIKANPDEQKTLDELSETIKWQILRQKQAVVLNSWVKTLKDKANVKIDKKAIGIE